MKKRFILCMLAILSLLSVFVVNVKEVDAKDSTDTSPYTTQVIGLEGELVNSSTAYEAIYIANIGFANPSDIFIDNNDIVYIADKDKDLFNDLIIIPSVSDLLSPALNIVVLQLLAYYIAEYLGKDVDQPRNLAKSVTVE